MAVSHSESERAEMAIQVARTVLVRNRPFFGALCLNLIPIETSTIKTMACDEKARLIYNPKFVLSLPIAVLNFAICHELLHISEKHFSRCLWRDPELFNRAGDYAINLLLKDVEDEQRRLNPEEAPVIQVWKDCLLDEKYRGMPSEVIYNLLKEEQDQKKDGSGDGGGKEGSGIGTGACGSAAGGHGHEHGDIPGLDKIEGIDPDSWASKVASAAEYAKAREEMNPGHGYFPAGLSRYVAKQLEPILEWRMILARLLRGAISAKSGRDDFSYRRMNRRIGALRSAWGRNVPILSSMVATEPGEILLALDTSASIGKKELQRFASEAAAIIEMVGRPCRVICVDWSLCSEVKAKNFKAIVNSARGGGGTSFVPIFEYADTMKPKPVAVVVFTDLCGGAPAEAPKDYTTIWCSTMKDMPHPWGKRIDVDMNL